MIKEINAYFKAAIAAATDESVVTTAAGDNDKPQADQTRVRVKLFPRETANVTMGPNGLMEEGGFVQVDVIGPRMEGAENVFDVAQSIVDGVERGTTIIPEGQLMIWSVSVGALSEEAPYLRVPVTIRWTLLHN